MIRLPPRSTRTDTLFPYTTLFRSCSHCDQFNGIHETLIEAWKSFGLWGHRVHFTCSRDAAADLGTVDYLRDTALQAGRSEERRVGKECVSTCRSRWSPDH